MTDAHEGSPQLWTDERMSEWDTIEVALKNERAVLCECDACKPGRDSIDAALALARQRRQQSVVPAEVADTIRRSLISSESINSTGAWYKRMTTALKWLDEQAQEIQP